MYFVTKLKEFVAYQTSYCCHSHG